MFDDEPLAGRHFQDAVATFTEPSNLGDELLPVGRPPKIIKDKHPARNDPIPKNLQGADFSFHIIQIEMQERDLLRNCDGEAVWHPALCDDNVWLREAGTDLFEQCRRVLRHRMMRHALVMIEQIVEEVASV